HRNERQCMILVQDHGEPVLQLVLGERHFERQCGGLAGCRLDRRASEHGHGKGDGGSTKNGHAPTLSTPLRRRVPTSGSSTTTTSPTASSTTASRATFFDCGTTCAWTFVSGFASVRLERNQREARPRGTVNHGSHSRDLGRPPVRGGARR